MRAVANRRPEPVQKRFTPNPAEGGAERRTSTILNQSWPVLDNAATSQLATEMIAARNLDGLVNGLPWADFMDAVGQTALPFTRTVAEGVRAAAMDIGSVGARVSFANVDAVSTKYGYTQSAKLVRSITDVQQATIRQTVGAAMEGRYTVDETARVLRRSIGLFPAWAQAVENRRALLNRQFLKGGMSAEKAGVNADRMADRYSKQLVKRRSLNIARTEIQTASNIGRYATWGQMVGSGLMAQTSMKEWAPGAGACPRCSDMAGETVGWDQPFSNGLLMPPAHVCCRCAATLIPATRQDQSLNPVTIDWLNPSYADIVPERAVEQLTADSPFLQGFDDLADTTAATSIADEESTPSEPLTMDEAAQFFNTQTVAATDVEQQTVGLYQAGMDWNKYLRDGIDPGEYKMEHINMLTDLINKQPGFGAPIQLYRGLPKSYLPDLQPGVVFKDEGFMSTTLNPDVASNFAGTGTSSTGYTPILQIIPRATDRGLAMKVARPGYMEEPNALTGEAEVLLKPGTTMRVVSVSEGKLGGWTHTIVKVEIVDG